MIASDDPVTCAEYAKQHDLLETTGWKRFRRYAKIAKKLNQLINQAKLQSYRGEPFWKFGVLVPRTHSQAMEIDVKNGNTKWQDAETTEMSQLSEYQTFVDKVKNGQAPTSYKKIYVT